MKSSEVGLNNTDVSTNTKGSTTPNDVPIDEEVLGSTYNNVEGSDCKSQQLRTSARVFKKMKLDNAIAVTLPIVADHKKEMKEELKLECKKPLRPSWSQEDKNLFFDALNEYGKDFEAIYSHITQKLRKKGLPDSVMKTKDQVRHFYYRTWHKISKHLKFSEDIKKIAQELYGLINYGELRKKVGSVSEKTCMKLNELIYRGGVAIRKKGKTIRIKTPMCRALRKLNQLDEKHDDLKLPNRVNVELKAKDMNSWLIVQGMSQNPRVKASLPLQKRLSTLIKFLDCKWKTVNDAAYENILSSSISLTNDSVPEKKIPDTTKIITEQILRLTPPVTSNIELPTVNLSEYLTSHSICLNAFEERVGVKIPGEQLWVGKGTNKKGGTKRARNESSSEKSSPINQKPHSLPVTNIDNNENCINGLEAPSSVNDVIDEAVNTILSLKQLIEVNTNHVEDKEKDEKLKVEVPEEVKDGERKEQYAFGLRNGWSIHNCGTITIGELYLMFGSNSTLILEYSWDNPEKIAPKKEVSDAVCSDDNKVSNAIQQEIGGAEKKSNETENILPCNSVHDNNLLGLLQKLLSIAKLHYRKNIIHCPCGHVCGANNITDIGRNKPIVQKPNPIAVGEKYTLDAGEKTALDSTTTSELLTTSTQSKIVPITRSPICQLSPLAVFRRPVSPNIDSLRAQLDSIQRLKPRYCNRRGRRPRVKQVVVERRLPLLPNKIDNGRQIVQMNIISHQDITHTPRTIAPKILNVDKTEHNITSNSLNLLVNNAGNENQGTANFGSVTPLENLSNIQQNDVNVGAGGSTAISDISDNAITPSRVGSPTSISNLFDMALNPESDGILNNGGLEIKDDSATGIPSFVGLLSNDLTNTTPPTSPSRILKENESNWLNCEVADFSLSSFLGHLESPMKSAQPSTSTAPDDTRLSADMDVHLQSLLTESSVDYMAKFADLAAHVVSDVKK